MENTNFYVFQTLKYLDKKEQLGSFIEMKNDLFLRELQITVVFTEYVDN